MFTKGDRIIYTYLDGEETGGEVIGDKEKNGKIEIKTDDGRRGLALISRMKREKEVNEI